MPSDSERTSDSGVSRVKASTLSSSRVALMEEILEIIDVPSGQSSGSLEFYPPDVKRSEQAEFPEREARCRDCGLDCACRPCGYTNVFEHVQTLAAMPDADWANGHIQGRGNDEWPPIFRPRPMRGPRTKSAYSVGRVWAKCGQNAFRQE